jgi:hypothetical protein
VGVDRIEGLGDDDIEDENGEELDLVNDNADIGGEEA